MIYYLNLGSNLGNPRDNLKKGIGILTDLFDSIRVSDIVESEPWGFDSGNRFANVGVAVVSDLSAPEVLALAHVAEKEFIRRYGNGGETDGASHRNADGSYKDRLFDVDIMDVDGNDEERVDYPDLKIPHPHLQERDFFLTPLRELRGRRQIILYEGSLLLSEDLSRRGVDALPTLEEAAALHPKGEVFGFNGIDGWEWYGNDEYMKELSGMLPEKFPEGYSFHPIRPSWERLGMKNWNIVARMLELANWDRETRYCGRCGSHLYRATEISKICRECKTEVFPKLSPAILVLVTKGEEALLVHASTLPGDIHALVAGFVETGESLEECVRREVREETSLEVCDIRYYGSQSWPFPGQMMIAFTARYSSGELQWADGEITRGGFFRRDSLPDIPTPPSLSRSLIQAWIDGRLPED